MPAVAPQSKAACPTLSSCWGASEVRMCVQDVVEQMEQQLQRAGPAAELSQLTASEELIQVCLSLLPTVSCARGKLVKAQTKEHCRLQSIIWSVRTGLSGTS